MFEPRAPGFVSSFDLSAGVPPLVASPARSAGSPLPGRAFAKASGRREAPPPRAKPASAQRSRTAAHAAYHSVDGGGPKALDAALAVLEDEVAELRQRVMIQEQALKVFRLYARDSWMRRLAAGALDPGSSDIATLLPEFLYDPELAETCACCAGGSCHD